MVKHATSLFNSFCSNVAKQVERFCCPFRRSLTCTCICMNNLKEDKGSSSLQTSIGKTTIPAKETNMPMMQSLVLFSDPLHTYPDIWIRNFFFPDTARRCWTRSERHHGEKLKNGSFASDLIRSGIRLSSTRIWWIRQTIPQLFESALQSGNFWICYESGISYRR